jgi:RimJ/RimL family protein N-acetyltransferase
MHGLYSTGAGRSFEQREQAVAEAPRTTQSTSLGWRKASVPPADRRDGQLWLSPPPAHATTSSSPAAASESPRGALAGLFASQPARTADKAATSQAPIPVRIETERLVLRVLEHKDFEDYAAMMAEAGSFRFSERGPMGRDEAWTRLLRHVGHWAVLGWGLFAVEDKATGRFVGEVGLGDFRRCLATPYDSAPEAGWTIAPEWQGRGYATEAMQAALAWIRERLGAERTVCLIHADNAASLRVAAKLGFRTFAHCRYRGYDALLLERMAPVAAPKPAP